MTNIRCKSQSIVTIGETDHAVQCLLNKGHGGPHSFKVEWVDIPKPQPEPIYPDAPWKPLPWDRIRTPRPWYQDDNYRNDCSACRWSGICNCILGSQVMCGIVEYQ